MMKPHKMQRKGLSCSVNVDNNQKHFGNDHKKSFDEEKMFRSGIGKGSNDEKVLAKTRKVEK